MSGNDATVLVIWKTIPEAMPRHGSLGRDYVTRVVTRFDADADRHHGLNGVDTKDHSQTKVADHALSLSQPLRPVIRVGVGAALVIFALAVSLASRFVLVLGGVLIVWGVTTGIARLMGGGPDSSRGAPGRCVAASNDSANVSRSSLR